MIFHPNFVNEYSLEQLFLFIMRGIVTIEDLMEYGLVSHKVKELKKLIEIEEESLREKENQWFQHKSREEYKSCSENNIRDDIKVSGKIDINSLNQSTRLKHKSKEERQFENEKQLNQAQKERGKKHIGGDIETDLWKIIKSLFGTNRPSSNDLCNAAIFAPAKVERGDIMFVQVFLYKDDEKEQVVIDAQTTDVNAVQRSYTPLNIPIKQGDKITITLNLYGLNPTGEATKNLIWQNRMSKCCFFVEIPTNYINRKVMGDVYLSVNDLALGQMSFFSDISNNSDLNRPSEVITKPYKKVFISYSHKDDNIVKAIADAYKAIGVIDYFYDRHSLSPGEVYEQKIFNFIDNCDLFVLCWSKNAEVSEWVKKERVRASTAALCIPPKLRLYPINISPYAAPPSDMIESFHFEDYDKLLIHSIRED